MFGEHVLYSVSRDKGFSCCDRKSRAACAPSFAPWQQATIEIMLAISLTIACSRYTYDGVILPAHPVRGESHNQRNTTGEVATPEFKSSKHVLVSGKRGILQPAPSFHDALQTSMEVFIQSCMYQTSRLLIRTKHVTEPPSLTPLKSLAAQPR